MWHAATRWTLLSLTTACMVVANVSAQEKDQKQGVKNPSRSDQTSVSAVSQDRERASGVIVKTEPIRGESTSRPKAVDNDTARSLTHRLTINTAAVWRDWVRDQAGVDLYAPAREQARRGADSVATKGEPQSVDTLVVIDVGPDTVVETRFRATTDETTRGARTPDEAREARDDPKKTDRSDGTSEAQAKDPSNNRSVERDRKKGQFTRFQAEDLQPGLFVEIDFQHKDGRNLATNATVIRPVGGPDTPIAPKTSDVPTKK
jgi:hypothetical protein